MFRSDLADRERHADVAQAFLFLREDPDVRVRDLRKGARGFERGPALAIERRSGQSEAKERFCFGEVSLQRPLFEEMLELESGDCHCRSGSTAC